MIDVESEAVGELGAVSAIQDSGHDDVELEVEVTAEPSDNQAALFHSAMPSEVQVNEHFEDLFQILFLCRKKFSPDEITCLLATNKLKFSQVKKKNLALVNLQIYLSIPT